MQNTYQNDETEISIVNLMVYLARGWKAILVGMLAFAVILGGYRAIKPQAATVETDRAMEIDAQITLYTQLGEIYDSNSAVTAENELLSLTSENAESAIGKLNALYDVTSDDIAKASIIYFITDYNEQINKSNSKIESNKETLNKNKISEQVIYDSNEELEHFASSDEITEHIAKLNVEKAELAEANSEETVVEPEIVATKASVSSIIKYAIIGMILGAIVVCGVKCCVYVFGGKLQDKSTLQSKYGWYEVGSFQTGKKKDLINKKLDKLCGIPEKLDESEAAKLISSKIKLLADTNKYDTDEVLILGTAGKDKTEYVGNMLGSELSALGFKVHTANDPVYDGSAALDIKNGIVLIVEQIGKTKTAETDKLADLLCLSKSKVIGTVVL